MCGELQVTWVNAVATEPLQTETGLLPIEVPAGACSGKSRYRILFQQLVAAAKVFANTSWFLLGGTALKPISYCNPDQ